MKPPAVTTSRSRASPAWAPRASPTSWSREAGALQADGQIRPEPTMSAEDVADAVLYMAGLPLDANVQFLTVMATKMPFIGRG